VDAVKIVGIGLLAGISFWVFRDAKRRHMSTWWAIGVGLVLIFFLPLYLVVRKPVKCTSCGTNIHASRSLCETCEERAADEECAADIDTGIRLGRIFG
jgi:hypothetical protein